MATSTDNRTFWAEFILLYKNLPVLWNQHSQLYNERSLKADAYDTMAAKLQEMAPKSGRMHVVRKINIFRTNYRRELNRINRCRRMGKEYKTSLWYFNNMSFLESQPPIKWKRPRPKKKDKTSIVQKTSNTVKVTEENLHKLQLQSIKREQSVDYEFLKENDDVVHIDCDDAEDKGKTDKYAQEKHQNSTSEKYSKAESNDNGINLQKCMGNEYEDVSSVKLIGEPAIQSKNNAFKQAPRKLHGQNSQTRIELPRHEAPTFSPITSQASDILAKSWAIQYEEMSDKQKIYARKAIADILFEGCMGNLGGNCNGRAVDRPKTFRAEHWTKEHEVGDSNVYEDGPRVQLQDWIDKI